MPALDLLHGQWKNKATDVCLKTAELQRATRYWLAVVATIASKSIQERHIDELGFVNVVVWRSLQIYGVEDMLMRLLIFIANLI